MARSKTGASDHTVLRDLENEHAADAADLDWQIAKTKQCNVLVIGSAQTTDLLLAALMLHLDSPVCGWRRDTSLPRPGECNTLVIRDVEALTEKWQLALLSWLDEAAVARTRVVSTTTVSLFQRVRSGQFLEVLYYRLNTVVLSGTDSGPYACFSFNSHAKS